MEYLEDISLEREKESRKESYFKEKIGKELQNYQLQKNNLRIDKISEKSEDKIEKINEDNSEDNKMKEKNNTKQNNKSSKTYITKNININNIDKNKEQKNNEGKIFSLYKYDIFSYARHGHFKELEKLFLEGINPDSKDKFGNTLLIISAQNNNKRILKLCLRYGGQINMQNLMGNTALHFAKEYGYEDIFEYLIKKGADPNIKNLRGIPAFNGLYKNEEDKLFLGKEIVTKKIINKNVNKYKKFEENFLNEIK